MTEEIVNIYDAKTGFSRLVSRVEHGERVTISRNGHPVARLVPIEPERTARVPGALSGRVRIAADFDAFDDRDAREWFGE
ncbi:type II toxin-antitoxin system Phd/YefM family antitoxin [Agromyces aureus]|uniref:Antitoxin n=1 Tax=Agromyces aureus TaxID=453304 RepID=A0A191WIV8_9MICO|nr:type II toxin-antitoxin system prevent-host-death family antitoxin [Agromyces aureus]ANJ28109.1 antitoxin [Agromyces aureus]